MLAEKGNCSKAFNILARNKSWIVDSGATDHMTGCVDLFFDYKSDPRNETVKIADGTFSIVAGSGSVKIAPDFVLKNVLYVAKLACNLLSISRLETWNALLISHKKSVFFRTCIRGRGLTELTNITVYTILWKKSLRVDKVKLLALLFNMIQKPKK